MAYLYRRLSQTPAAFLPAKSTDNESPSLYIHFSLTHDPYSHGSLSPALMRHSAAHLIKSTFQHRLYINNLPVCVHPEQEVKGQKDYEVGRSVPSLGSITGFAHKNQASVSKGGGLWFSEGILSLQERLFQFACLII